MSVGRGWVLVAVVGCSRRAPETAEEFFLEIGEDWCDCAVRELPEEVPPGEADDCASGFLGLVWLVSSDDACVYDDEQARACVEITRRAEVACAPGPAVSYDGVPFEDIPACAAAWSCAAPDTTP